MSDTPELSSNPVAEVLFIPQAAADSASNECLKAKVLRAAYDISPAKIPEDLKAANFNGYNCSFRGEDGSECAFADPVIFLKKDVGFVAMGSGNSCELEGESPRAFKKAALGGISARAVRLGKEILAFAKQKRAR